MNQCKSTNVLTGGLLLAFLLAANAQNLLTNGSFEVPALSPGTFNTYLTLSPGGTNLPGWSVGGSVRAYLVLPASNRLAASDGQQYVDLHRSITLSQAFSTIPGETYEVSFTVGRFQSTRPLDVAVLVLNDGETVLTNVLAAPPQNTGWSERIRFQFVATTSISSLQFTNALADGDIDLELDDVVVEPTTPHLSIAYIGTSTITISWKSQSNQMYQLQYRAEFNSGDWTELGAPLPGTGSHISALQPTSESQQFYRLLILP